MATRSFIVTKEPDGYYSGVYCHFDGYPEGVGTVLQSSYNTQDKVWDLIDQGSISFLKETIEESRFYHTWRNDPLEVHQDMSWDDVQVIAEELGCEYLYSFEDNKWNVKKIFRREIPSNQF